MKTTKKLAYFCVAVLSNVFCLTSCTSEEVNPNYDAERGVVKTEFTISIPAKPAGTRMSAGTVQASGNVSGFRGIEGIKLYSFKSKVAGITEGTALPSIIDLAGGSVSTQGASGTANNTIANSGALFTNNNAHLYQDIEVPIGTQAFMIYGVAMPSKVNPGTPTTAEEFAALASNGTLTDNLSSAATLDAITFSPVPIYANSEIDALGNGPKIADYLTSIAQATGWSASDYVVLQTLYQNFITMRAGSWASVKGAVQQLYTSIYSRTDAVSTAIKGKILDDSNVNDNDPADGTLEFTDPAYGNYPADIHLPDGAAYVKWNGSAFQAINYQSDAGYIPIVLPSGTSLAGYYSRTGDEGSYTYTAITTGTADGTTTYYRKYDNTGLDVPNLNRYVYPAPLYYRALSNIRTANASKKDVYSTAATWADVLTGTGGYGAEVVGTNDIVKATTRSIAIVDQVQYAVGRLDANVHTQSSATTLKDYENTDISIKDGSGKYNFPITGILIGGQKAVDYKFEQKDGVDAYTIYDNAISDIYLKETESNDKTHTLVFETKDASVVNDPNCVTKISVEFQNDSGKLFVGKDGEIIYPGSKFYLVGTFDPFLNTTYNYAGTTTPIKRTFVQDYVTTANLVIASLKSAYNTVPDLRAPQLELGLSVDITWQTGISQTITIP